MDKAILTDGIKSLNLLDSDDPQVWTFFSGAPVSDFDVLYAQVSAVFRALNLKANTVGNMPFSLNNLDTGKPVDESSTWENKVKFLPNPSELLRLDTLSCMVKNSVYNLLTSDVLGYRPRGLYNASPYNFTPYINVGSNQLEYIQRANGTKLERYDPNGKPLLDTPKSNRLIYMWRRDHTTEVLPSLATEASAIMKSAEVLHYADVWIAHFYRSGGIPPTAIALKGNTTRVTKEDEEKSWNDWLMGIRRWFGRRTRVYNADSLEVKQFGSSVTELKDNPTYRAAIENIAMGTGMPLSLLLANSANYATAQQEKSTWYENDIIPFCNWLAYGYNEKIFMPIGLYLEFHPETLDPQQEDETQRAQAFSVYGDTFTKYPTYGLWSGMAGTLGLEISQELDEAAQEYYTEKNKKPEPPPTTVIEKQPPEAQSAKFIEIKANDNSSMIALRIPDSIRAEIKERYSFVDEETLNELHITLVYLGDNRTLNKVDIVRAVSELGIYQAPIKGTLQGLARFINGQDVDPLVVTFDSPQMPKLYYMLCGVLESYHVPYHKEHGFIPHMTLAYIPKDSEMPIETIEPIEINFSEVHYVDGDVWLPVELTGYENKNRPAKWIPTLDELQELKTWRKAALSHFKQGKALTFEYQPHYGGLPEAVTADIQARLAEAREWDEDGIKTAFEIAEMVAVVPAEKKSDDITGLTQALNHFADALFKTGQIPVST